MAAIIKYVFWDFGDTLVHLKPNITQTFTKIIFQKSGRKVKIYDLNKAMRDEWAYRDREDELEKIKSVENSTQEHQYYADFFKGTLRRLGIEHCILPELTAELSTLNVTPSSYSVFPDALKIVSKLSKLGVKQAIISNGFHAAPEIFKHSELPRNFEFIIWSYEYRTIKPEHMIYELALDRAGCRPEEAVFVDDRPSFVAAAKELGMFAIQIDRSQNRNTKQGDQKSFPVISNLATVEKYISFEKSVSSLQMGYSKNKRKSVRGNLKDFKKKAFRIRGFA